jgi:pyroglutamyl-peptidase
MRKTILLTGFGPFPGVARNPTDALVQRLARRRRPALADTRRIAHVFRTSYEAVETELPRLIKQLRPDLVLMFGVAARTPYVRIESRAVNARSALHPDVDARVPRRTAIRAGGPTDLRTRAPVQKLLTAARKSGVPVALSRNAGRYLCNFSYWQALDAAGRGRPNAPRLVQFIHVPRIRYGPWRTRMPKRPPPALDDLVRTGEAILMALLRR